MADNPMARVRASKLRELAPFSEEEIQRLLSAVVRVRGRAIILCLLDTGRRASELLGWNVCDAKLQTGVVQLRTTKGRKPRTVYLVNADRRLDVPLHIAFTPDGCLALRQLELAANRTNGFRGAAACVEQQEQQCSVLARACSG